MAKGESVDQVTVDISSPMSLESLDHFITNINIIHYLQVDGKRRNFSSTVNILVSNHTDQVLTAKKEWVKGGEAFNRPNDIMPGKII